MGKVANKKVFSVLGSVQLINGVKKFVPHSEGYFSTVLARIPVGKQLTCTISEHLPTRSEAQLDYHFVLAGLIADHTGDTKEELHDAIMRIVFGTKLVHLAGRSVQVRKSISGRGDLTVADVSRLIQFDLDVCDRLDIHVPTPEELGYISNH